MKMVENNIRVNFAEQLLVLLAYIAIEAVNVDIPLFYPSLIEQIMIFMGTIIFLKNEKAI